MLNKAFLIDDITGNRVSVEFSSYKPDLAYQDIKEREGSLFCQKLTDFIKRLREVTQ